MTNLHEVAKQIWLQSLQSVQSFNQKIHNMEPTFESINRETVEGKLLLAAIIELTTKLHRNKTPDEVIQLLWDVNDKCLSENRGCIGDSSSPDPFQIAVEKSIRQTNGIRQKKEYELRQASSTILKHATPSMNPDDFVKLEELLVKLYRHICQV